MVACLKKIPISGLGLLKGVAPIQMSSSGGGYGGGSYRINP